MKKLRLMFALLFLGTAIANAQLKKDGTPDMRYKANKQNYGGSTYSAPTSNYNTSTSTRYQSGYTKSDGTYVQSHTKTNINSTNVDNLSTKDNYNIYNGTAGSKPKDYSLEASNYVSGKTIQTGKNGGQYYINDKGNKVYAPKTF